MRIVNKKSVRKTRKITKIGNNKPELIISKLKQIYKDVNSSKKKPHILGFIFNYYLLLKGYRNIFQIYCPKELVEILNKYNIKYIVKPTILSNTLWYIKISKYIMGLFDDGKLIIIYNDKKINIDEIDNTFGEKFGKQLGDFYICASADWERKWHLMKYRINISISHKTHTFATELYGQMCVSVNDTQIIKLKKIAKDISVIIKQFDENCITTLKFTNLMNNSKNLIFSY